MRVNAFELYAKAFVENTLNNMKEMAQMRQTVSGVSINPHTNIYVVM